MVGIVGHKAQPNPRPTANIPEQLQFRAPVSTQFPGGHITGIGPCNTLEDLQVVITATVKTTKNIFLLVLWKKRIMVPLSWARWIRNLLSHNISGPYIKWRLCRSHLGSSHSCQVGITDSRKLKTANIRSSVVAWSSYQIALKSVRLVQTLLANTDRRTLCHDTITLFFLIKKEMSPIQNKEFMWRRSQMRDVTKGTYLYFDFNSILC